MTGANLPGHNHILLVLDSSLEAQQSLCIESLTPAGWQCIYARPDAMLEHLLQQQECTAVLCTPQALGQIPPRVLEGMASRVPLLVGSLPLSASNFQALEKLAAPNDDAPAISGPHSREKTSGAAAASAASDDAFQQLLSKYEYQSRLFNYIASTTPDFIYVFNREGQFVYANARLLTVWGLPLEEIVGKTCRELGYEQWHHDMHMREIAQVIETKKPIRGEVPFRAALTGIFGVYEYIFTPVLSPDGTVEVIAGTTRDVTERKMAEEAMRESKQLLEVALAASSTGTFRWDPVADEFLAMDATFQEIFGISPDVVRFTSSDVFERIHPDDCDAVVSAVRGVTEGRDLVLEFRVVRPDGSITWVFDRAKAIRDPQGKVLQVVGACTDITKLKLTELELRAEQRHREFVMESMPQKIFLAAPDGSILYYNKVWVDYTGLSKEDLKNWREFIHPQDLEENIRIWQHSLDTGEPFYYEHRFRSRDGHYRWHVSRAVPMRDEEDGIQLWIGSCTDVDDMKVAQQALEEREDRLASLNLELQQARDAALAASSAKSMFLASMSHELRTPLNAIIGYSEMLRDELTEAGEERLAADMMKILLSGKHLHSVVSDILDLSKIEAGKMEFDVETFNVHEVVQEAITLVAPLIEKNSNQIEVVAQPKDVLLITSDRMRIRQILFNLLSNAAKFTDHGQISITCTRGISIDGVEYVELAVADTGIGIAADKLQRVFQEFTQLERRTHRMFGGTGLGLSISRRLCQLLGGDIHVQSEQGVGSVFTIRLPVVNDWASCRVNDLAADDGPVSIN